MSMKRWGDLPDRNIFLYEDNQDYEWHTPKVRLGNADEQIMILNKFRKNLKKGNKYFMSFRGANNFNISESDEMSSKSSHSVTKEHEENASKNESNNSFLKPLTPYESKRKKSTKYIEINVFH